MRFHIFLKEEVEDVPFLVAFLVLDSLFLGNGPSFFQGVDFVEVYTGVFLYCVHHGDSLKGFAQIHFHSVVGDGSGTKHRLSHMTVKVFGKIHHAVVVGVSLVQLHQGKFRIVTGIQTFVAEHPADLINSFQAADDQPLQVQLQGDPQFQIFVEGVEVGFKGTSSGASGVVYQNGGFHFHEPFSRQIGADGGNDLGALHKSVPDFGIHNQVHVPLTVPLVGVGQAMELFRQGLEGLAQQGHLMNPHRNLSGFGGEYFAFDTDDVADVVLFKPLVGVGSQVVPPHKKLHPAAVVLQVGKAGFAHNPFGHHPSGQGDGFAFVLVVVIGNVFGVGVHRVTGLNKRIHSCLAELVQLFPAYLQKVAELRLLRLIHLADSLFLFPCDLIAALEL